MIPTIIISLLIAAACAGIIRDLYQKKRQGKGGCGCGCSGCGMADSCHGRK